jgi:IS1 transposase
MRWCVTGMPPTGNRSIAVMPVGVVVARIRLPMPIQKLAARRSCMQAQERSGLRGLTRTDCASLAPPSPVGSKKSSSASSLAYHPARPGLRGSHFHDTGTRRTDASFVLKKANDSWIWIALCRKTRQVVAYAIGKRSKQTCQRLWEAIPQEYHQGHCFTDFLRVSASVIRSRSSIQQWVKRREKPPVLSVGITRYANDWPVLSA